MNTHVCPLLAAMIVGVASAVAWSAAPDPQRVEAIARMLPETPCGVGRPIDDRVAWDLIATDKHATKIIRLAEGLLTTPMTEISDDLYLEYSRNGNRSRYEAAIDQRRARLDHLVLAECLENRGRFLPEIEKCILATCDEKTWVLSAHDRGLTNFRGTEITIDLHSSSMGWMMATIDYWLAERLSPATRKRIAGELERRVFRPFEGLVAKGQRHLGWLRTRNNHNSVQLANVTGAALTRIPSRRRRAFFVASAEKYIQSYLSGFTADGNCSEGLHYWNYGFGHYVLLAETIFRATDGQLDLMTDPQVKRIARFSHRTEITPGVYPGFADCDPAPRPSSWLRWYVSRRLGLGEPEGQTAVLSLKCSTGLEGMGLYVGRAGGLEGLGLFGFAGSPLTDRTLTDALPAGQSPRDWFDEASVLICRAARSTDRPFGAAMKGGHNGEQHNHNDVGSFVVAVGNHAPLLDPGFEVYTARTFSRRRYVSGVINSWGHPVPRVAGSLQKTGRAAAAKVLETNFTDMTDTLALDLRAAYDVEALKELTRRFVFSREGRGSLEVTDRVVFEDPHDFGTALITFDAWKRSRTNTLQIGTGRSTVEVQIDTNGIPFKLKAKPIEEDLPSGKTPTRLGIELSKPIAQATVRLMIRPAE